MADGLAGPHGAAARLHVDRQRAPERASALAESAMGRIETQTAARIGSVRSSFPENHDGGTGRIGSPVTPRVERANKSEGGNVLVRAFKYSYYLLDVL